MSDGLTLAVVLVFVAILIAVPLILVARADRKKAERKKADDKTAEQKRISDFDLLLVKSNFKASKAIHFGVNHFAVDMDNNKVYFDTGDKQRLFSYSDIIAFELIEDGNVLSSGSTGKAIAGGVLFGAMGAIVGSTMNKSRNVCSNMQLRIAVNDIMDPTIIYNLVSPPGNFKDGAVYPKAFGFAKDTCDTLTVIQKQIA